MHMRKKARNALTDDFDKKFNKIVRKGYNKLPVFSEGRKTTL